MKLRNGFVSNSSSASFVLAFPKDNPVELKNIEDWFGGFTEVLSPEDRDMLGFILWRSQYFDEEMERRDWTDTGEEYNHYTCSAPFEKIKDREIWNCPGYISEIDVELKDACKSCKYLQIEKRLERGDDYYFAKDTLSEEAQHWLEEHKNDKIVYLEIDDNNPARGIPYDIAYEITSHAYELFDDRSHNLWVCGGK